MLVVGSAASEVHTCICRRMLGGVDAPPRRRLLVFTNGTFSLASRIPRGGSTTPAHGTKVVTASTTRSATAERPAVQDVPVEDLGRASLSDLGVAISEAIAEFEDRYGPLAPAELRLCVDSLSPLLDVHGEQAVFEFLVLATRYVREFRGMGHFHLPVEREARVARLLAPLFDGVVEVGGSAEAPRQRWHLRDGDVTSQWLPL